MQKQLSNIFQGDKVLWTLMGILAVISIIMVYSSTGTLAYMKQGGNTTHFMVKHTFFLGLGFGVAWVTHHINYKVFAIASMPFLILSILLLIYTLFFGENLNSASRWVNIMGIKFQPSELAKYATIMFVALRLGAYQTVEKPPEKAFKTIVGVTLAVASLILTQNLSTALMIGGVVACMLLIGRVPIIYIMVTLLGTLTILSAIIFIELNTEEVVITNRVETWIGRVKPLAEAFNVEIKTDAGDNYQSDMAKAAISTGGFFGKGPGNGVQKHVLPHPYSDFIYAVIIEEGGFLAGAFVLSLYFMFLVRLGHIVKKAKSTFPVFLTVGVGLMIFMQAFIHMGVSVGIGPVTGQTLPLVSMGGTSIIITGFAFGMILSVSKYSELDTDKMFTING